jgi:hypothetical protein
VSPASLAPGSSLGRVGTLSSGVIRILCLPQVVVNQACARAKAEAESTTGRASRLPASFAEGSTPDCYDTLSTRSNNWMAWRLFSRTPTFAVRLLWRSTLTALRVL